MAASKPVLAFFIGVSLCVCFHVVHGYCPSSVVLGSKQLLTCLAEFNRLTVSTKGSFNPDDFRNYCRTKAETEIACTDKLIADCRETRPAVSRELAKAVNLHAIGDMVKLICAGIDDLNSAQYCIRREVGPVSRCLEREEQSYERRLEIIKSWAHTFGSGGIKEEIYKAVCNFIENAGRCQHSYHWCGKKAGEFFDTMVNIFRPPICDEISTKGLPFPAYVFRDPWSAIVDLKSAVMPSYSISSIFCILLTTIASLYLY